MSAMLRRKSECALTGKKPAIVICDSFAVWLGNTTDADMTLEAGELFGFGRGTYEHKVVGNPLSCHTPTMLPDRSAPVLKLNRRVLQPDIDPGLR